MKVKSKLVVCVMVGLCFALSAQAQKTAEMEGTWSGLATLEGMDDANELVLVLTLEEGALKGHMTDEYGTMSESAIDKAELKEGVFTFEVKGFGPNGEEILLVFKMEVDGTSMKGTFDIPDMGMAGEWEAEKG